MKIKINVFFKLLQRTYELTGSEEKGKIKSANQIKLNLDNLKDIASN